ncbi:MAG: FG-GAP-like repeat-containing protein [Bacteroidota bacterium]
MSIRKISTTIGLLLALYFPLNAQFGEEIRLTESGFFQQFQVGDLDGDGRKDILSSEMQWYRQQADGTFEAGEYLGRIAERVNLYDLDANGTLDIIFNPYDQDSLLWLPNLGNMTFEAPRFLGRLGDAALTFADIDQDGDMDFMGQTARVNTTFRSIAWFQNDGSGNFTQRSNLTNSSTNNLINYAVLEDFDEDGDLDVFFSRSSDLYWVEHLDGQGNFASPQVIINVSNSTSQLIKKIEFLDIDHDNKRDLLLLVDNAVDPLRWYRKTINNTFESDYNAVAGSISSDFTFFVAQLNQDTFADVLLHDEGDVFWLEGKADNIHSTWLPFLEGRPIENVIIEDLDGDGKDDFIYRQNNKLYRVADMVWQADGNTAETPLNLSGFLRLMDMGDINGDGLPDIVTQGDRILWQANLPGKPVFAAPELVSAYTTNEVNLFNDAFVKLVDWDTDGDLDILSGQASTVYWYPNEDGLGDFGPARTVLTDIRNVWSPFIGVDEVTLMEDFDGNGKLDFVGLPPNEGELAYWRNDGNDQFTRESIGGSGYSFFSNRVKLTTTDVGADGDQDIIFINDPSSGNNVIAWIENVNGVLQAPRSIFEDFGLRYTFPMASDLNQNGQTYIFYQATPNEEDVKALRFNNGDFENLGAIFSHPDDFELISTQDIDGDGDEDLVISFSTNQTIHWVENDNGSFTEVKSLLEGVALPRTLFYEDISGDGLKDLVYLQGWDDHPASSSFRNPNAVVQYEQTSTGFDRDNRAYINSQDGIRFGAYIDFDGDDDLDYFGKQQDHFFWKENYDGRGNFASERIIGDLLLPEDETSDLRVQFFDHGNDDDLDFVVDKRVYELENLQTVRILSIDDNFSRLDYFKAADLNGDGFEDLYGYGYRENYLAYYEYLPASGTYAARQELVSDYPHLINGVNAIDFDNDNDLDLFIGGGTLPWVIGDGATPLQYILNDGSASFAAPDSLLGNVSSRAELRFGDINQDGTEDVLLVEQFGTIFYSAFSLNWYAGIPGTDSLSMPTLLGSFDETSSSVEPGLTHIFLEDLDGDGDLDAATSTVWFENLDGRGDFSEARIYNDFNRGELYANTQFGDVDGDGVADLLQAGRYKATQNVGGQPFGNVQQLIDIREENVATLLHRFDVDLDGDMDLLAARGSGVYWYRNDLDGDFDVQFTEVGLLVQSPDFGTVKDIHSADMNGDGREDLLMHYERYVGWYEAEGDGTMSSFFLADYSGGDHIIQVFLTDVDGDGDTDIVKSNGITSRDIRWIENRNGDGLFDTADRVIYDPQNPGPYVSNIAIADVDEDGDMDVVFNEERSSGSTTVLYWIENTGGNFSTPNTLLTINSRKLEYIAHLDLDLDNDQDFFIVTNSSNGAINQFLYYQNNGSGYDLLNWSVGQNIEFYQLMDANNDYLPDLLLGYLGDENLYWSLQDSIATFAPVEKIRMKKPIDFNRIDAMAVGDFDGDFDLDIFYTITNSFPYNYTFNWRKNLVAQPVIRGRCFFDENRNKQLDSLERGLNNFTTILNPLSLLSFSDTTGIFRYVVNPGSYELGYQSPPLWELTTDSMTYNIFVDTAAQEYNYQFGFYPTIDTLSIEPFLTSAPTRCSFEVPFWLDYHNTGTRIASGTVRLVKPSDVEFISASIDPDSIYGDTLDWHFSNLYPFSKEEIGLLLKMPNKFATGLIYDFETIVEVNDTLADSTYINQHIYSSRIRCAIDPNDKLVSPNRLDDYPENYTLFGEELEYTIRFQNTGNDTAFNVVITDQLDANLDWNSLEIIGASHAYTSSLDSSGLLTFEFRNILLPDSTTNEPLSHGYVSFRISPKEGLSEMTIIENTAAIFFDFNAPIITNTTENNLVSSLNFSDSLQLLANLIRPLRCAGDSTGTASFDISGLAGSYEAFLDGQLVAQAPADSSSIALSALAAGSYTLTIVDSVGHRDTLLFTITAPAPLVATLLSNTPETCDAAGTLEIEATGGTAPYQYLWSDSTTTAQLSANAGSYQLTITDSNGCTDTASYDILLDCPNATRDLAALGIKIYPNPLHAQEHLIVETPFVDYEIHLFNALGQRIRVEQVSTPRHTLQLQSFAEGIYWLVMLVGTEQYSQRIVKLE